MKNMKMIYSVILSLLALTFVSGFSLLNKEEMVPSPSNLKVELLDTPYGIDTLTPSFSWSKESSSEHVYQEAYHMVISKSKSDMENNNYIYNSGWQNSSVSSNVEPRDLHLLANTLYYWKVQTRDNVGIESPFSEIAVFSTGLFDSWRNTTSIWSPNNNNYCFLRGEFFIESQKFDSIEKVLISVSASSGEKTRQYVYNLYCNETPVGLGPARATDKNTTIYNTYDITEYIHSGINVIGSINYTDLSKQFLCQVTVFYSDGSSEIISNSGRDYNTWLALDADSIYGNNLTSIATSYYVASGDNIDGTIFPFGWCSQSFDSTGWDTPVVSGAFESESLIPYSSENMMRYPLTPISVKNCGDNRYFIDLGKEIVGGLSLSVNNSTNAPCTLTIRSGETLNTDGTVKYIMGTANIYEEFWTFKTGEQTLENIGMKTIRYIDIYNCPFELTKDNVKGLAIRQNFSESDSSFESSNELLNRIYKLSKYTIKATNQDLYVDSQSRERGPYEGDVLLNAIASYALEDDYTLARYSNEYLFYNPTWPAEYKLYSIIGAWTDYMYTGNLDSLKAHYDILKDKLFMEYFDDSYGLIRSVTTEETQVNSVLVDWPETERDNFAYSIATYNTVFNAVNYQAYLNMYQIAKLLNKKEEAKQYLSIATTIKKHMISALYNDETGGFSDGLTSNGDAIDHYSQHATAYALAFHIYTDDAMADKMASFLEKQGEIRMSPFASYFLLKGLYDSNNGNYATSLLCSKNTKEGARTWAYMLDKSKATITTEAWNTTTKPNMTYSHPWSAAPAALIATGLFGIEPTSPAFSTFQLKIQAGNVSSASIQVPTIKGIIKASYQLDRMHTLKSISITIPENTTATIHLPSEASSVIINKERRETFSDDSGNQIVLGSGLYELKIKY